MTHPYTFNPYYKSLRILCENLGADLPEDLVIHLWETCEKQLSEFHGQWVIGFFSARIASGRLTPLLLQLTMKSGVMDINQPFQDTECCVRRLPLEAAVANDNSVEVIQAMLDMGADPEKISPQNNCSAVQSASSRKDSKYEFIKTYKYIKENRELKANQAALEARLDEMMQFLQQMNIDTTEHLPHKKLKKLNEALMNE